MEFAKKLFIDYNYPSIGKFKVILKKNGIKATHQEILNIQKKFSVKEIHRPIYDSVDKQMFITSIYPFEMVQIDLLDYTKYATRNKNYKYILIGIDIFTRKAFAQPIKEKTPNAVKNAFKKFDFGKNILPTSVYHDSGNEFKGDFLKYLDENDIVNLHAKIGNHHSLGIVDRFSRTLKTIIAKFMTANETAKYIDRLEELVDMYNQTPHISLLDYSPSEVINNISVQLKIQDLNFEKIDFNKELTELQQSRYSVGDNVRIKLKKRDFEKGYEPTYSNNTYKVVGVEEFNLVIDVDGKNKRFPFGDVLKSNNPESMNVKEKEKLDSLARARARLAREGL